MKTNRGEHRMS